MKKLNKKGFTLIELLAVIVLLAIVGVVGANRIIKRLNTAKRDTFVNTYNDVKKELNSQIVLGDGITPDKTTNSAPTNFAKDFDLSETDYTLNIVESTSGYTITLKGTGTYSNMILDDAACSKVTNTTTCEGTEIVGTISE